VRLAVPDEGSGDGADGRSLLGSERLVTADEVLRSVSAGGEEELSLGSDGLGGFGLSDDGAGDLDLGHLGDELRGGECGWDRGQIDARMARASPNATPGDAGRARLVAPGDGDRETTDEQPLSGSGLSGRAADLQRTDGADEDEDGPEVWSGDQGRTDACAPGVGIRKQGLDPVLVRRGSIVTAEELLRPISIDGEEDMSFDSGDLGGSGLAGDDEELDDADWDHAGGVSRGGERGPEGGQREARASHGAIVGDVRCARLVLPDEGDGEGASEQALSGSGLVVAAEELLRSVSAGEEEQPSFGPTPTPERANPVTRWDGAESGSRHSGPLRDESTPGFDSPELEGFMRGLLEEEEQSKSGGQSRPLYPIGPTRSEDEDTDAGEDSLGVPRTARGCERTMSRCAARSTDRRRRRNSRPSRSGGQWARIPWGP